MIDLSPLVRRLAGTPLASWSQGLQAQLEAKLEKGHGDLDRWRGALEAFWIRGEAPAPSAERLVRMML